MKRLIFLAGLLAVLATAQGPAPTIDPQVALQFVDGMVARANATRLEHAQAQQCVMVLQNVIVENAQLQAIVDQYRQEAEVTPPN
jgi:hypothetical protein